MKQIIFLDDERVIQDVTWIDYSQWSGAYVISQSSASRLISYIKHYGKYFDWENTLFSLDHDLQDFDGEEESTGYTFIKWLIEFMVENEISLEYLNVVVHSQNPIGKENIEKYISNAKLHYLEF
ncbi:hypothetical protein AM24_143 [Acinetobacter phage AM24]|nr:hypothetical protein AM24_143 [Acinetobacter phage AM24]